MWIETNQGRKDMTMRSCVGKKAKLLAEVQNSLVRVPAGTVVTLSGTYRSGFEIRTDKCSCCGVAVYVTKIPRWWLEVIL